MRFDLCTPSPRKLVQASLPYYTMLHLGCAEQSLIRHPQADTRMSLIWYICHVPQLPSRLLLRSTPITAAISALLQFFLEP